MFPKEHEIQEMHDESKRIRPFTFKLMFVHFFITNILINIDHGIIPAAVTEIK